MAKDDVFTDDSTSVEKTKDELPKINQERVHSKIGLQKADLFVDVEGHYGGRQKWLHDYRLASEFRAKRSCGIAAVANILTYQQNEMESLLSEKQFAFLERELMDSIPVRIYGIPLVSIMKRGLRKYARSKGQAVQFFEPTGKSMQEILDFLSHELSENRPVMMIHWNTKVKELENHWVTITELEYDGKTHWITTSNWGQKKRYALETVLDHWTLYRRFLSFELV